MGKVRRRRNSPPGPVVSAMVKFRPYLRGISKSTSVESNPPICTMLMTKSAPRSAWRRSCVAFDFRVRAQGLGDFAAEVDADLQPIGVDVHVAERRVAKFRIGENVAGQIPGKDDAAGADHGDL